MSSTTIRKSSSTCDPRQCYRCWKHGHIAARCPGRKQERRSCYQCGKVGHLARSCQRTAACYQCGQVGHLARNCQRTAICFQCGQAGHLARNCAPKVCSICQLWGHLAATCDFEKRQRCAENGHRGCPVAARRLAEGNGSVPICMRCFVEVKPYEVDPPIVRRRGTEYEYSIRIALCACCDKEFESSDPDCGRCRDCPQLELNCRGCGVLCTIREDEIQYRCCQECI
jgi:cellular nucleic acid-binding protein